MWGEWLPRKIRLSWCFFVDQEAESGVKVGILVCGKYTSCITNPGGASQVIRLTYLKDHTDTHIYTSDTFPFPTLCWTEPCKTRTCLGVFGWICFFFSVFFLEKKTLLDVSATSGSKTGGKTGRSPRVEFCWALQLGQVQSERLFGLGLGISP